MVCCVIKPDLVRIQWLGMLGETWRQVMGLICGSGDFLAYGSPSISAPSIVLHLQLAKYCDAPGYKVRTYDTEELFYHKKTAFPATYF